MNRHAVLMRGLIMAAFLIYCIVIIVVAVVYKTADAFLFFF